MMFRGTTEEYNPNQVHLDLLKHLLAKEGTIKAVFNKRQKILKTSALKSLTNPEIYRNHFNLHETFTSKNSVIKMFTMIQELQTTSTLVEIKHNSEIFQFLRQHKIHFYDHAWKIDKWNVKTIGFLPKFSPIHHPKDLATKALNMTFKHESKMPNF
jgi:hypothetical protein